MAQFGELLAELRKDHKMKQSELAEKIFVSTGTISNYENGVHYPDVEKLISLADLFGVTTDYLLGRCSSSLSPDVFGKVILGEMTVGNLIQNIYSMTPDRKQALSIILNDMKFGTLVGQYCKKE